MNYCVADFNQDVRIEHIRVGVIGSDKSIERFCKWMDRCESRIEAKVSRQPNLFPMFPGFNGETGFRCELRTDSSLHRVIRQSDIEAIATIGLDEERTFRAVDLFVEQARDLLEKRKPDVLVCPLPEELLDALDAADSDEDDNEDDADPVKETKESNSKYRVDFHDLLKARCLVLPGACPLQLVLPGTYDPESKRRRKPRADDRARPLQDEATRAWNFWTAVYYKAGGTPWRLMRDPTELQTCHVGIGFFRTLDRERINASVAQIFNERGEGVIVRGGEAKFEKSDRQIHLDRDASLAIVTDAIEKYRFGPSGFSVGGGVNPGLRSRRRWRS